MKTITIRTKEREYIIQTGKPAIVVWNSKNRERKGISTAIGWILPGDKPKTIRLIHSCFQTIDKLTHEYPASWTIWTSQIIAIKTLSAGRR